jgi:hypothetical protein
MEHLTKRARTAKAKVGEGAGCWASSTGSPSASGSCCSKCSCNTLLPSLLHNRLINNISNTGSGGEELASTAAQVRTITNGDLR